MWLENKKGNKVRKLYNKFIKINMLICISQSMAREVVSTHSSFNQILCANVNHGASNSLCRVKAESMVFIPLPWVKDLFGIDCSFVYGPWNSYIDKLTAQANQKQKQRFLPSIITKLNIEMSKFKLFRLPEENTVFRKVKQIIGSWI